jgi:predicted Zn-ribbon and HTH transcriptional regulator
LFIKRVGKRNKSKIERGSLPVKITEVTPAELFKLKLDPRFIIYGLHSQADGCDEPPIIDDQVGWFVDNESGMYEHAVVVKQIPHTMDMRSLFERICGNCNYEWKAPSNRGNCPKCRSDKTATVGLDRTEAKRI